MQTDIVPKEMGIPELVDRLPQRDARVIRKILEAMVDWNISFPRALENAMVHWDTRGTYDSSEFEGFERSLDTWIELGKRYG